MPLALQLDVTNQCNLNCSFCYNFSGKGLQFERDRRDWEKFCLDIMGYGGIFQCTILGGSQFI